MSTERAARTLPARDEDDDEELAAPAGDLPWTLVLSRVLAAAVGCYLLCYTFVGAAVRFSPLSRPDTVLASTMAGLVLYIVAIIWVIAARSSAKVWGILLALSAIFYVVSTT